MKIEAWIILVMFGIILYFAYRNGKLREQIRILTRARVESGAVKYPMSVETLQQTANDILQIFDERALAPAFCAIKRVLRKLGLNEDFVHELEMKISMMDFNLLQVMRRKEALETAICGASQANVQNMRSSLEEIDEQIMNLTTGLMKARKILNTWRIV